MRENDKQPAVKDSVKAAEGLYGTAEQSFFGGARLFVGIITLFCSGVLFAFSGYEAMVRLLPFIPTFAAVPLVISVCVAIWLGIPAVLLLVLRSKTQSNSENSKIGSVETLLKVYMLCLTLFAALSFLILMFSGKIANFAIDWLLKQSHIIQTLENLLPQINEILAANDFLTFESIPDLINNPDTLMGVDIGIKTVFALLTLLNALTSSMLKHAILTCGAVHKVLNKDDAPEEIPQRVSLLLYIAAVFGIIFAIASGMFLGSVILVLALVLLSVSQIAIATALKHYRDERLLEILSHKKKRG